MTDAQPPALPSTKPYLLRAIYEWCCDNGFTPYLQVAVNERVRVPREFVQKGEIVLNLSPGATNRMSIGNELITFQARFGGVARDISVPMGRVAAIFARENSAGMAFDVEETDDAEAMAGATAPTPAVAETAADVDAGAGAGAADHAESATPPALVAVPSPAAGSSDAATDDEPPPPATPGGSRPRLQLVK